MPGSDGLASSPASTAALCSESMLSIAASWRTPLVATAPACSLACLSLRTTGHHTLSGFRCEDPAAAALTHQVQEKGVPKRPSSGGQLSAAASGGVQRNQLYLKKSCIPLALTARAGAALGRAKPKRERGSHHQRGLSVQPRGTRRRGASKGRPRPSCGERGGGSE